MPTRNQKYASSAYENVKNVKDSEKSKYKTMTDKLPVLIHSAGLAQALSFVDAKANSSNEQAWKLLLTHLATTIGTDKNQLLERSRMAELAEYMKLTRDVLAALSWYKRFAQALLN
ncbi:MAG: type III-B CRISPR module-associated protein Cmr5 [Acidobacteria bacterium]|nr:type III-B CRISPR module-associated protein Cmr5 [Acidobacteriota bacterium]